MAGQSKRGLSATKSRSSGFKGGRTAAAAKRAGRPATKQPPAPRIAGEKAVRATRKTVGVEPEKPARSSRAARTR